MVGVVALVGLIMIVFVATFVIYYVIYNKKINERIKNQESTAHNAMASVDTVGKFWLIFFGVAVVFIMFSELSSLKSDIAAQQTTFSSQISDLEMQLSNLEEKLDKQNSLVNQFECIVGTVDTENRMVEMEFICTPKAYSKDTKLTLMNGDKKIVLVNNGSGKFTAKQSFSIFETFEEESIIQQEDAGSIKTSKEMDLISGSLVNDCLPTLGSCDIPVSISQNTKNLHLAGSIAFNEDMESFTDLELYVVKNNERVKDLNVMEDSFSTAVSADENDTVMIVISGVDQYGYMHKSIVAGSNIEDECQEGDSIYDTEGNLLFGEDLE